VRPAFQHLVVPPPGGASCEAYVETAENLCHFDIDR
jgi:hypothetical protein